jgi:hypothetical protein
MNYLVQIMVYIEGQYYTPQEILDNTIPSHEQDT